MVDLTALCSGIARQLSKDGKIVVWNLTSRCNLECVHCYSGASNKKRLREFTTKQAKKIIKDLKEAKVSTIIFSGGEPLLRKDIFELSKFIKNAGMNLALSTNGTLIDEKVAAKLKNTGIEYIGISIDGTELTHNLLRQKTYAFQKALSAVKVCKKLGLKVGLRFTIAKYNIKELRYILGLIEDLKIPRFCLYSLVYSGRGEKLKSADLSNYQRRLVMDELISSVDKFKDKTQILTTDNPCDGVYVYKKLNKDSLNTGALRGGCSAGVRLFNIDSKLDVHPCQFWQDYTLGNCLERRFSEIINSDDELLKQLRNKEKFLKGKCGLCNYKSMCGGCRVRAKFVHGDIWQEDPSCYLNDIETRGEYASSFESATQAAAK